MLIAAPSFATLLQNNYVAPIAGGIAQTITIVPGVKPVSDAVTGQPVIDPLTGLQAQARTWANYMYFTRDGRATHLQSVMLEKIHPERKVCCGAGWITDPNEVLQIGKDDVNLVWPLLYEVDGTIFKLTVTYTTDLKLSYPASVVGSQANPASRSHVEVYEWTVVNNSWTALFARLDYFSILPAGTCETFAVTPLAKAKFLTFINGYGQTFFGNYLPGIAQYLALTPANKVAAAGQFAALEAYVDSVCGTTCGGLYTTGLNAGTPAAKSPDGEFILDNPTVPAASVLLNDIWAVGKTLNVLIDVK